MKSGVVGVIWNSKQEKWVARITKKGQRKLLYSGPSLVDAIAARQAEDKKRVCSTCGGKLDKPSVVRCKPCRKARAIEQTKKWRKQLATGPVSEKPTDGIPWPASL